MPVRDRRPCDPDGRPAGTLLTAVGLAAAGAVLVVGVAFAFVAQRRAAVAEQAAMAEQRRAGELAEWEAREAGQRLPAPVTTRELTPEAAAELEAAFAADPAVAAAAYRDTRWRFAARVGDAGPGDTLAADVEGVGPATIPVPAGLDWAGAARGGWFTFEGAVERFEPGADGGVRFARVSVYGPAGED